jgi:hypothetical protein
VGNEAADTEAKAGAASSVTCTHARTTKTWMLAQTQLRLRECWLAALPDATPSMRFPDHLKDLSWPDTRALWRLHAGRTPSDRDPGADHDKDPEPCNCGDSYRLSAHILLDCRVFLRVRARMLQKAPDVTLSSIPCPAHSLAVVEFLRTTRPGYTADLTTDEEGGKRRGDEGEGNGNGAGGARGRSAGGEDEVEAGGGVTERAEDEEWRFGLFE